jgi:Xaa-Pro aminopeptidase
MMLKEAQQRMSIFQRRMREQGASLALLTDENSIVYLAGFWGYLGLVGAAPLSAEFCGLPQLRAAGRQKAQQGTP